MSYKMIRLGKKDIHKFKQLAQESFQKGYEDEFGAYDKTILPEEDIDDSLYAEGTVSYAVVESGEIIAGAIVNINKYGNRSQSSGYFVC